tara:strand:- start:78 stop:701 length:624 start_codon:yes stop_codon:yes gene_type:complete
VKKLFFFLSILLFINCDKKEDSTYKEMKADRLLSESFTDNELQNLAKIVDFFEIEIYKEIKERNIEKSYNEFLKRDSIKLHKEYKIYYFDYKEQKKLYSQLDSIFFKNFWDIGYESGVNSNEKKYEFFVLKSYSKYGEFLKELSKNNKYIADYYVDTVFMNDFLNKNATYNLSFNYRNYNFKDIKIRLVFALHFLCNNEFFYKNNLW